MRFTVKSYASRLKNFGSCPWRSSLHFCSDQGFYLFRIRSTWRALQRQCCCKETRWTKPVARRAWTLPTVAGMFLSCFLPVFLPTYLLDLTIAHWPIFLLRYPHLVHLTHLYCYDPFVAEGILTRRFKSLVSFLWRFLRNHSTRKWLCRSRTDRSFPTSVWLSAILW